MGVWSPLKVQRVDSGEKTRDREQASIPMIPKRKRTTLFSSSSNSWNLESMFPYDDPFFMRVIGFPSAFASARVRVNEKAAAPSSSTTKRRNSFVLCDCPLPPQSAAAHDDIVASVTSCGTQMVIAAAHRRRRSHASFVRVYRPLASSARPPAPTPSGGNVVSAANSSRASLPMQAGRQGQPKPIYSGKNANVCLSYAHTV